MGLPVPTRTGGTSCDGARLWPTGCEDVGVQAGLCVPFQGWQGTQQSSRTLGPHYCTTQTHMLPHAQVILRLAAPRWPPPQPADDDGGGGSGGGGSGGDGDAGFGLEAEVQARQRRQAFLELGAAIDAIRPRPPAWTFAPLVT